MSTASQDRELGTIAHGDATLRVAAAGAEHIGAIVELLANDPLGATRESSPDDPAYRAAFDAIDVDPNQVLLVVLQSDRVVGTAQLSFLANMSHTGAMRSQIEGVRIHEDLRGGGLGAALMHWVFDYARGRGAVVLQLTTSRNRERSVQFYERLGFSLTHNGMKRPL